MMFLMVHWVGLTGLAMGEDYSRVGLAGLAMGEDSHWLDCLFCPIGSLEPINWQLEKEKLLRCISIGQALTSNQMARVVQFT